MKKSVRKNSYSLKFYIGTLLWLQGPCLVASEDTCALKTPSAWQHFISNAANNPEWVETCEDSYCEHGFYSYVEHEIFEPLQNCEASLANNMDLQKCVARLKKFVPAWLRQHDNVSYGFNVTISEKTLLEKARSHEAGVLAAFERSRFPELKKWLLEIPCVTTKQ